MCCPCFAPRCSKIYFCIDWLIQSFIIETGYLCQSICVLILIPYCILGKLNVVTHDSTIQVAECKDKTLAALKQPLTSTIVVELLILGALTWLGLLLMLLTGLHV